MKKSYSDAALVEAVKVSANFTQLGKKLGLKRAPHEYLKRYVNSLGLDISHFNQKTQKYSDDQAAAIIPVCTSFRQVILKLGISSAKGHYNRFRRICKERNIGLLNKGFRGLEEVLVDEISRAVLTSYSFAQVIKKLGITGGGTQARLKKKIKLLGINIDHFTGQKHMAGKSRNNRSLESILVENSNYSRHFLKKRLLQEGLLLNQCSVCGQEPMWHGKPLVLILDHINGVYNDNRLINLRIVCLHCDSQSSTYCWRNIKRKLLNDIDKCLFCGKECSPKRIYCSSLCYHSSTKGKSRPQPYKVPHPSREELANDIATMPYLQIGKKYGVSDNAVRKWAKAYDLPTKSQTRKIIKI